MNKPRLIDANVLIEWLTKPTGFRTNCEDCSAIGCIDCIIEEAIKNTPTAYDIDKVVEQLEEISYYAIFQNKTTDIVMDANKAIEIVKGGTDGK